MPKEVRKQVAGQKMRKIDRFLNRMGGARTRRDIMNGFSGKGPVSQILVGEGVPTHAVKDREAEYSASKLHRAAKNKKRED